MINLARNLSTAEADKFAESFILDNKNNAPIDNYQESLELWILLYNNLPILTLAKFLEFTGLDVIERYEFFKELGKLSDDKIS